MSRVSGFQPSHSSPARGFTLVELMIVIVIVAILLAVALPSYQNSVQKGRRADAKSALLDVPIARKAICWIGEPILWN